MLLGTPLILGVVPQVIQRALPERDYKFILLLLSFVLEQEQESLDGQSLDGHLDKVELFQLLRLAKDCHDFGKLAIRHPAVFKVDEV